jgi:hypothetical protein
MCWNDTLVTVEQAKVGQAAASSAGADAGFGQPRDASEGCCV